MLGAVIFFYVNFELLLLDYSGVRSSRVLEASDSQQVLSGAQMGASSLPLDWELLTRSEVVTPRLMLALPLPPPPSHTPTCPQASSGVAPVPDFIDNPSTFLDTLVWRRGSISSDNESPSSIHHTELTSNSEMMASSWATAYHHLILDETSLQTSQEKVGEEEAGGPSAEAKHPQVLPEGPQKEVSPPLSSLSCEATVADSEDLLHSRLGCEGVGKGSAVGSGSSEWLSTLDSGEERSGERYGGRVWTAFWWHSVVERAGWVSLWATALAAGLVGVLLLTHRWQQERRRNEVKMMRIINTQQQVRWMGPMCVDKWHNRSGCWAQTIGQMTVQLVRLKEALTRQRRVAVLRSSASFPTALSSVT